MEEVEKITLKKWEEKDLHKRTNLWPSPLEIERKKAKRSRTTSWNRMIQLKQIDKISILNDEQSERLKSALYLRLKKRKFSKYAQDVQRQHDGNVIYYYLPPEFELSIYLFIYEPLVPVSANDHAKIEC